MSGRVGGYGDSFSRNPELVNQDLKNGIVSIEKARSVYGVVVD
jgi:N-methylhydantoinase B/oxoprolinase/acetone carboxylase alpha subunit